MEQSEHDTALLRPSLSLREFDGQFDAPEGELEPGMVVCVESMMARPWRTPAVVRSGPGSCATPRCSDACMGSVVVDPLQADVAMVRRSRRCPVAAAAVADGSLSVDQFAVIAAANTSARAARFAEAEELLVQQCITLDLRDTRIVVQHWSEVVDELLDTELEVQRQRCVAEGVESRYESRGVVGFRGSLT